MRRLRNERGADDTITLLLKAREAIRGSKNKTLNEKDITVWPRDLSFFEKGLPMKKKNNDV
jgi:hypothetical protein